MDMARIIRVRDMTQTTFARFVEFAKCFPQLTSGHGGSTHDNRRCVVPGCDRSPKSGHFQDKFNAALDWLESVGR